MIECPLCKGAGTVDPDMITIGDRLRALRGTMRQEEMAQKIGIGRTQVANLEANRGQPSLAVLMTTADEFDVTVDWILGRTEQRI